MEENINIDYGSRGQKASASKRKGKRSSLAKAYEESPEKSIEPHQTSVLDSSEMKKSLKEEQVQL